MKKEYNYDKKNIKGMRREERRQKREVEIASRKEFKRGRK